MDIERLDFGDTENINYISTEEALKIIKKILSDNAYDLEIDDYILIEDDGVLIGKKEDFDDDVFICTLPAKDVVEFTDDDNFIINEQPLRDAIADLF